MPQKKVLSLVLCVAMLLSVMVMGTGAAFTDEDDFSPQYAEAAEVLAGMKVMQGYDDGSFLPQRNITRAQVATMIYRAATSDVTDTQTPIYADYDKFDDVQSDDWFAGYVNYCGNAELIKGFTPTTFGPNKNVTGYQVLAMILRAVGYDQNDEFTGSGWEIRTASTAESLGILDNVQDATLGQPATRELVAELIFRAMIVPTVEYTNAFGYQQNKTTLGWNEFKLFEAEGTIVANEIADLYGSKALDTGKTELVNNFGRSVTYNLTTDTSIIGEKVNVWIADETAVSTPASLADVTDWSNLRAADLTNDQEDEWADATNGGTQYFVNYDKADGATFDKGIMIKAIDNNNDGDYEYVLTEIDTLTFIDNIDDDGDILLNDMAVEDKVVAYDAAAEGDVVLAINIDGGTYLEKAAFVTGNVTGLNTKDETATIGDAAYMVSGINYAGDPDLNQFATIRDTYQPGADWNGKYYNYYQDAYGNIRAYEEAGETATGYGLILDYDVYKTGAFEGDLTWRPQGGLNVGDLYVKFLTEENTVETAKVDADFAKYFGPENDTNHPDNDPYVNGNIAVGDVVSYNINEDGELVLAYTYDYVDAQATVQTDRDLVTVDSNTYNVDENLVVFYYTDTADTPIGSTFGWVIPVYGVLTGEDALADIDGKTVHQMDAVAAGDTHVNKFGEADMINISGHIDTFVDYCYVEDFADYTTEKVNGEYIWTYDAINSSGEAIQVSTRVKMPASDKQVWEYHTLDVNGTVVNALLPTSAEVMFGDLHLAKNGQSFDIYEWNDQNGENLALPETGVFALVEDFPEGGTTNLDVNDCATGYAVVVNDDTKAVFVTEAEDGNVDYVDTTIDTETADPQAVHVKIGTSICFGDEYANGTYTWTPDGAIQPIEKPLSDEGCLIVDASMEDVTVNVKKHEVDTTYAATIDSVKFDSEEGASFTLTAHKYLDGEEDPSHTVHNVTADVTIYTEDGTPVQTNTSVATGLDTSITVNTTCKLTAGQKYYAEITLTCNGQKYPTVTTDVFQAQPDAVDTNP
ncbi:MAG: S-layer homology domain-containing protein [Evtepia sp.]